MSSKKMRILGLGGSLRKASYNRMVLKAAAKLVPENVELEIFELGGIPPFSEDLEQDPPEAVKRFKQKIKEADAILVSTPEYNYSIPGFLKNAIDWASRPYGDNAFDDKPVAIMGASMGAMGTSRAQYHLRQTFVFLNMHALNDPEVMISNVHEKFDEEGNLKDEYTKQKIRELVKALIEWAKKLKQ